MRRPFEDIRPLGPFADFSNDDPDILPDIVSNRNIDFYTALRWVDTEPKRLYHTTSQESLGSIADDEAFVPLETGLPEIFLTAAPEESLGSFTLLLDTDNMIDKGFSPRCATTFTLQQLSEQGYTPNSDRVYETERGYIVSEWHRGYIDPELFAKYEYPDMGDRLVSESDYHCYSASVSEWSLEPYGELEVLGNPPYTINLAPIMQQTFARYVDDRVPLSSDDVKAIIYDTGYDRIDVFPPELEDAAETFNAEMINYTEASKRYEELRGGSTMRD